MGITIANLMAIAYGVSLLDLGSFMGTWYGQYISVFAFGLVAFGFLGMGPVTIAVDSYGPVTDNAQSVYELSLIENVPDVKAGIKAEFGFDPDFDHGKHFLEENDGAGNTFKATAKPVLIGTAVIGATTMIFSIILLQEGLPRTRPTPCLSLVSPGQHPRLDLRRRCRLLVLRRFHAGRDDRGLSGGGVHQEKHQARHGDHQGQRRRQQGSGADPVRSTPRRA